MALTARLSLLTSATVGTELAPNDWNRVADCLDNLAGRPATDLHPPGVVRGWTVDADNAQILPGVGWFADGLRAETQAPQAISGLQPSTTTYVWAAPTSDTPTSGAVQFVAQANRPAGGLLLHQVETDASGSIVRVNGAEPGVYDYWREADISLVWQVTAVTGTIELTARPGQRYRVVVDHSSSVRFALAEPPRFQALDGVAVRALLDGTNGEQFAVEVEVFSGGETYVHEGHTYVAYAWPYDAYSGWAAPETVSLTLSWERRGIALPGRVAP